MKVVCLSQYPPDLGGIASHVRGLQHGLAGHGWRSEVIRPAARGEAPAKPLDDGPDVRVHSVPARAHNEGFDAAYALQNLQVIVGAMAPGVLDELDAVVCHGSQFALAALMLRDLTGRPLLYHAHNVYSAPQTADGAFQPGMMLDIEREIACRADGIIAISGWVADLCLTLGADPDRMTTIPKGLHMADFAGEWRPPASPTALFVGRLSPEKGLETYFEAIAALAATDRPVTAVVVGSGDGPYVDTLRRRVADLGVAARVWFVGQYGPDRLVETYQRSGVTVVPSYMEALGRVAIEAMASGCPVVVTDVGGLGPLVEDGVTGWKVPTACVAELADAIWHAVGDPAEAGRRAEQARTRVQRDFTYEAVIAATQEFYRRIVP